MAARIQLPSRAKKGELMEIRLLIQHPMETGYRVDDAGKTIERNTIRTLVCRYNGVEVLRVDMSSGIAANPYIQFYAVAEESGELQIDWVDDAGVKGTERQPVTVME
jgi:sulfur-oxidizing protein SoxZ